MRTVNKIPEINDAMSEAELARLFDELKNSTEEAVFVPDDTKNAKPLAS